MKGSLFWMNPDGEPVEVVPIKARLSGPRPIVEVLRAGYPEGVSFWVLSASLRLSPGSLTDFLMAMRDVPGWLENDCERRVWSLMAQKGRRGKGSSLDARTGAGRVIRDGGVDLRPTR